ncbi:hypothetical protein ACIRPS_36035 [Streptomyces griseoviridis]
MPSVSDDEFWFDSDAMADPWRPPHAAEAAWMQDQLRELACKIADRISARGQECLFNGHEPAATAELFADFRVRLPNGSQECPRNPEGTRPAMSIRPLTWYFSVGAAGFEPTTSSSRSNFGESAALGWGGSYLR